MDALRNILNHIDIRQSGVAFGMLGISVLAFYSNVLALIIIPLVWMGYRIGKEIGRQEAHNELANAALAPFSVRRNR